MLLQVSKMAFSLGFGSGLGGFITIFAVVFQTFAVVAQEVTSREAFVVMVAFECATYAEFSGNEAETERLFMIGYKTAQKWLEAARSEQLSVDELEKTPIGILESLGGPTLEFQIGRIYSDTARRAFDRVHKEDYDGNDLPLGEWEFDEAITRPKARHFFVQENCQAIR